MSAREIIAKAVSDDLTGGWVEEYGETADAVIAALAATRYRILAPGELDPVALEAAAQAIQSQRNRMVRSSRELSAFAEAEAAVRVLETCRHPRPQARGMTMKLTAEEAFEIVAQWHDKNARLCLEASRDEPRMNADDRRRAFEAHKHHAASAACIRNKLIGEWRLRALEDKEQ